MWNAVNEMAQSTQGFKKPTQKYYLWHQRNLRLTNSRFGSQQAKIFADGNALT